MLQTSFFSVWNKIILLFFHGYGMSDGLQFESVCGHKNAAVLDIVFIHGLTGDPKETWTNSGGTFWPC